MINAMLTTNTIEAFANGFGNGVKLFPVSFGVLLGQPTSLCFFYRRHAQRAAVHGAADMGAKVRAYHPVGKEQADMRCRR